MNKLFLIAIAVFIGFGLLIDNSFVRSATRRIASTADSNPPHQTKNIDFSELPAEEFAKAFKYQLVTSAQLVQDTKISGMALGNFYIRGSDGQKNFVCAKYTQIELIYEADGIAVSGDIPRMITRGPCLTSSDSTLIESLPIPYKKILAAPVAQKEFIEDVPESNAKVGILFTNVVEQWPTQWNLVSIKLYSPESSEVLSLNGYEIIAILGQPLSLQWSP